MRFFKKTSIDFMGKRGLWYMISGTAILIGMVTLAIRGVDFGIDFHPPLRGRNDECIAELTRLILERELIEQR